MLLLGGKKWKLFCGRYFARVASVGEIVSVITLGSTLEICLALRRNLCNMQVYDSRMKLSSSNFNIAAIDSRSLSLSGYPQHTLDIRWT